MKSELAEKINQQAISTSIGDSFRDEVRRSGGWLKFIFQTLPKHVEVRESNGGWKEWTSGEEPMGPSGTATDPLLKK